MNARTTAALLAGLIVAAAAHPAAGDAEEDARIHFQQGVELYEQGDYEAAAIAFSRAYELKPSYRILFNIGQAEAELKHYALALDAFTRYLAEGGDAVPPERLTKVKGEIKRLNALVGMLYVECPVEGARVKVDAEARGETPLTGPIFVDIGKHEVTVEHGARELLREVVRVAGGQRVQLEVAVADDDADPPDEGGAGPEPGGPPADDGPERVWTWVALGVGGAAAIAGGAIGGAAMSRRKALVADDCVDKHCYESSESEADEIEALNLTADVLFGVAAAGIVTGIVLFFVEPDDDEQQVALAPLVTGDRAGLAVGGRF